MSSLPLLWNFARGSHVHCNRSGRLTFGLEVYAVLRFAVGGLRRRFVLQRVRTEEERALVVSSCCVLLQLHVASPTPRKIANRFSYNTLIDETSIGIWPRGAACDGVGRRCCGCCTSPPPSWFSPWRPLFGLLPPCAIDLTRVRNTGAPAALSGTPKAA